MKEESGARAEVKPDACMNGNEEKTSAEEKEAVGQMKDGEATTNNQSSLSRSTGPRTPQGKETVSYTHLDVYKRQHQEQPLEMTSSRLLP